MTVAAQKTSPSGKREFKVQDYRFVMSSVPHLQVKEQIPGSLEPPEESWVMTGYASTWDTDQTDDRIERGAFAKTIHKRFHVPLAEYGASDIPLFRDHRENIGITLDVREDNKGLLIRAKISKTRLGNDTRELLIDRAITRMSIGFWIEKSREEFDDTTKTLLRIIEEVDLMEVSAVTFPANDNARILAVKSRYGIEVESINQALACDLKGADLMSVKKSIEAAGPPEWLGALETWAGGRKSLDSADQPTVLRGLALLSSMVLGTAAQKTEDTPVPEGKDNPSVCPSCGDTADCESAYCKSCGSSMKKKSQEPAPETKGVDFTSIFGALQGFRV